MLKIGFYSKNDNKNQFLFRNKNAKNEIYTYCWHYIKSEIFLEFGNKNWKGEKIWHNNNNLTGENGRFSIKNIEVYSFYP